MTEQGERARIRRRQEEGSEIIGSGITTGSSTGVSKQTIFLARGREMGVVVVQREEENRGRADGG